ncbi:MAG: TonB-dependent receptor [Gemmatimonadota bacterium]|nr:TonB-dependent receptor [Gemmatimonadota bacterium]
MPAYQRVDLVASYALAGWRLNLGLRNALDERYFTTGGFNTAVIFPGDPRALQATLSTRF